LLNYTACLLCVQVTNFYVKKNIICREIFADRFRLGIESKEDEANPLILGDGGWVCVRDLSGFCDEFALELPKDAKQSQPHFSNTKVCYEYCSCEPSNGFKNSYFYIKYNIFGLKWWRLPKLKFKKKTFVSEMSLGCVNET
jgi:hypothetical protein